MYYREMFGFVHLYNGQEAISTGVIGAMKKKHDCFVVPTVSVHALCGSLLWSNGELFGKATGCSKGRGLHLLRASLVRGICLYWRRNSSSLGAAFSSKYKKEVSGDNNSDAVTCILWRWDL